MLLQNGGHASVTVVSSGGLVMVQNGGAADNTVLSSGAREVVQGGNAGDTLVLSGGMLVVSAGASASDTLVGSGGRVLAGGVASDTTISGGALELLNGGSFGSGAVTFASGGGVLQLDDAVNFAGLVAGFGEPDLIDLRDIAFASGTTTLSYTSANPANTSGTLTVTDGAHTAHVTLIG